MTKPAALYLQDAHDLRDGLEYVRMLRKKALTLSGKLNPVSCEMLSSQWLHMQPLQRRSR